MGVGHLSEAWVHDDLGDTVRATAARLNAVDFMNLVHQEYGALFDEQGGDEAMKADLLRRAGAFKGAAEICEGALQHTRYTGAGPTLVFELELCTKRDAERHTMDEVVEGGWG